MVTRQICCDYLQFVELCAKTSILAKKNVMQLEGQISKKICLRKTPIKTCRDGYSATK